LRGFLAGIQRVAWRAVKQLLGGGRELGLNVGRLKGAGGKAALGDDFSFDDGCDKGCHAAFALDDIDIDGFGTEGAGTGEEQVEQEGFGPFHLLDGRQHGAGGKKIDSHGSVSFYDGPQATVFLR
jgi:hypothetical protein